MDRTQLPLFVLETREPKPKPRFPRKPRSKTKQLKLFKPEEIIQKPKLWSRPIVRLAELEPYKRPWKNLVGQADLLKPRNRGECLKSFRPCPFVGCRFHLYLDILPKGKIRYNFPHLEPHEMKDSCALDIADKGGISLEKLAKATNLTRERCRQVIQATQKKIMGRLRELVEP